MQDVHDYDLVVHGPNGFYSRFCGHREQVGRLAVTVAAGEGPLLTVQLRNDGAKPLEARLEGEPAYPFVFLEGRSVSALAPGGEVLLVLDLSASDHLYAFRVTHDADARWRASVAGHA